MYGSDTERSCIRVLKIEVLTLMSTLGFRTKVKKHLYENIAVVNGQLGYLLTLATYLLI